MLEKFEATPYAHPIPPLEEDQYTMNRASYVIRLEDDPEAELAALKKNSNRNKLADEGEHQVEHVGEDFLHELSENQDALAVEQYGDEDDAPNEFVDEYGNEIELTTTQTKTLIKVTIRDTSGQLYLDLSRILAYLDAHVVVLCYSISRPKSLDDIVNQVCKSSPPSPNL